jgi:toxin YoeB
MRYRIDFVPKVLKTIAKYKKSDPNKFKRLAKILNDIAEHPRTGLGHPEALVNGKSITYSRHITGSDVIVYDIHEESLSVLVLHIEGHYDDK